MHMCLNGIIWCLYVYICIYTKNGTKNKALLLYGSLKFISMYIYTRSYIRKYDKCEDLKQKKYM